MSKQYYSVLTHYGTQAFASAIGNKRPLNITQMAVGDGNGRAVQPDSTRTSLIKEVYRANISSISLDPRNSRQVIFELTIPESVGGFYIREMGIFDQQNRLIAYANCPESFKPTLDSGSGKVQVLRMILLVSSSDAITLTVNDSVIFATRGQLTPKTITATSTNGIDDTGHSHQINHATLTQKGIVQLTNDTGLDSETLALTAKAGKALAQQIAQNRLNTTNLANQKVDKTAISDSVTSTSQNTVASSKAVKTVYDLAMAKQSPATTLAGYGITDFKVQSASGNVNQFKTDGIYAFTSSSNAQNLPTNNAYHIQVIAGKDSNWCRQIAKKAYSIETYERWQTNYEQDQWSPWVRVDGVDWADIRNTPNASTTRRGLAQYTDNVNFDSSDWGASAKALRTVNLKAEAAQTSANNANNNANNRVAKSGDTMTGTLTINTNEPRIHGNKNGQNGWFLGYPNNTNTEVFLHSYALNTELKLKSDRVETNKPLYVNQHRVAIEGQRTVLWQGRSRERITFNLPAQMTSGLLLIEYQSDRFYKNNTRIAILPADVVSLGGSFSFGGENADKDYSEIFLLEMGSNATQRHLSPQRFNKPLTVQPFITRVRYLTI